MTTAPMLWPALVMGLAGSLHCAGMCGPLALALPPDPANRARFVTGRIVYNIGRTLTYATMGAVFGAVGQTLVFAGWQRVVSIAVGAILLTYVLLRGRHFASSSAWIAGLIAPVKRALAARLQARSVPALFSFGLLNGLLPCGLVYLALAGAAATGHAVGGALFMAIFGVGTIPMMLGLTLFGGAIPTTWRMRFQRAIPAMVAVLGVLFVLRGLSLGIPYISPDLSAEAIESGHSCCH